LETMGVAGSKEEYWETEKKRIERVPQDSRRFLEEPLKNNREGDTKVVSRAQKGLLEKKRSPDGFTKYGKKGQEKANQESWRGFTGDGERSAANRSILNPLLAYPCASLSRYKEGG